MIGRRRHAIPQVIVAAILLLLTSCSENGVEKSHKTKNGLTLQVQWILDSENFPVFSLHVFDSAGTEIHTEDYSHLAMGYSSGFVFRESQDQVRVYTDTKSPDLLTAYPLK